MSVGLRLEFCRRQDNVIYLPAAHSHGGRKGVRSVENGIESMRDPAPDLRVRVSAIPCHDATLMVGG